MRRKLRRRKAPALQGGPHRRAGRIAFLGPLPPTPTGIATYDRAVLDGLDRIGFTREFPIDPMWPITHRHFSDVPGYELGVYQLGNNVEFHLPIYRMVWQAPGLIVLHDLALDDFVRGLQTESDPLGYVAQREALDARELLRSPEIKTNEPLRTPWVASVARRARGILVHSAFCRRYLEGFGCHTPIYVVPHPPVESEDAIARTAERGRHLRADVEARGGRFLLVAPGDVNQAKRLEVVLSAVAALASDVHVAIVGRRVSTYDVMSAVHKAALGERLHLHHDVGDHDFLGWLHASDAVVDLRHPHRGEVSGSLIRAMQVGRPSIVSATGTYLDAPEGTVVSVAGGPGDAQELAVQIQALADDPSRARAMGEAARSYMEGLRTSEATAHGYADAIRSTLEIVQDVTGPAMTRWAHALADVGVTQEYVDAGYGIRYARALESFKRSS
jgi:glycosyltransferase involved in cell wall biosynthesis